MEEAETEGGIALLSSPYVNPSPEVVKDVEWYKAAFPERTLVAWGAFSRFSFLLRILPSVLTVSSDPRCASFR